MALAGCPDSFLHHPYYQDQVEQTPPPSPRDLAGPGFPAPADRLTGHQEDDVDLEALVNDVNASLESLYPACSMQSETVPLLQNGQHARSQPPPAAPRPPQAQRSQPVHIVAVRRLQEEDQQLRTSSLPAIPNPFPELCGPGSPPVLTRGSLPPGQAAAKQDVKIFSEDGTSKVVEILADMTARDLCQLLVYRSHCVDDNSWTLVEHHPHLGLGCLHTNRNFLHHLQPPSPGGSFSLPPAATDGNMVRLQPGTPPNGSHGAPMGSPEASPIHK